VLHHSRYNSAKVWIAHTEYTISKKTIDGEMNKYEIADTLSEGI
jgi:DNA-binding CsgD family transcriptional regulator